MEGPLMDTQALPIEISKAIEKAVKLEQRAVKSAGLGASDVGMHITKGYVWTLAEHIEQKLTESLPQHGQEAAVWMLKQLSPEVLALCSLNVCLHSVAMGEKSNELFPSLG